MKSTTLTTFKGLDLRRSASLGDPKTALAAKNLVLTSGRVWRTRPGTQRVLSLPPQSKGLYAAGGTLRTVVPGGDAGVAAFQRPDLWLDFVEGLTPIDEFLDAEIYGTTGVTAGAQPYVVIRRGNRLEHHWCRERPSAPGGTVTSLVSTGFTPTGGILKLVRKIFAVANTLGQVRFSSTEFGPSDWSAERDAGFIPVQQHAAGDLEVTGLSYFGNSLVVFFRDQTQVWSVDPQPENFYLTSILNGPGTLDPNLSVNVLGDLMFFSPGGFRTLSSVVERDFSATIRESDIGAPIFDLTKSLTRSGTHAIWWQNQGLYLAAFGERVFCFKFDPGNRVVGWSEWELPFNVERFAVNDGRLYARSGEGVYEISEEYADDDGQPIAWEWASQALHMKSAGRLKTFNGLQVAQEGSATVSMRPDPRSTAERPLGTARGITDAWRMIPMPVASHAPGIVLRGHGAWQLDGVTIHYNELGA